MRTGTRTVFGVRPSAAELASSSSSVVDVVMGAPPAVAIAVSSGGSQPRTARGADVPVLRAVAADLDSGRHLLQHRIISCRRFWRRLRVAVCGSHLSNGTSLSGFWLPVSHRRPPLVGRPTPGRVAGPSGCGRLILRESWYIRRLLNRVLSHGCKSAEGKTTLSLYNKLPGKFTFSEPRDVFGNTKTN